MLPGIEVHTRRMKRFVGLLAAAAVILGQTTLHAQSSSAQAREQRRRRIADMTESERAQLQRNFKAFRELPIAEQERLRRLDRELKEDARQNGDLKLVMDGYVEWLGSLDSPGQREDLRRETNPDRREKMVRTLIKEQQERLDVLAAQRGNPALRGLGPADLDAALTVLVEHLRDEGLRTDRQLQELETKESGLARHVAAFELAFYRQSSDGRPQTPLRLSTPELADAVAAKISGADARKWISAANNPQDRGRRLFMLIYGGILAEFEKQKPDEEALERFFVELSSSQQDEILRLPLDAQHRELFRLYTEAQPDRPKIPRFDKMFGPFGGERFGPRRGEGQGRQLEGAGQRGGDGGPAAAEPDARQRRGRKGNRAGEQKPEA
ncbi:MAG: hypothetical protein ACKV0T_14455 [Planctomycetales bacterium]